MIKTLGKAILVTIVCVTVATLLRMGLRRGLPRIYDATYGLHETQKVTPALPQKQSEKEPGFFERLKIPEQSKPMATEDKKDEIYLTGVLTRRGRYIAVFSDGSVRTEEDNEPRKTDAKGNRVLRLTWVKRSFVDFDGVRYWARPHTTAAPAAEIKPEASHTPPAQSPEPQGEPKAEPEKPAASSWRMDKNGIMHLTEGALHEVSGLNQVPLARP